MEGGRFFFIPTDFKQTSISVQKREDRISHDPLQIRGQTIRAVGYLPSTRSAEESIRRKSSSSSCKTRKPYPCEIPHREIWDGKRKCRLVFILGVPPVLISVLITLDTSRESSGRVRHRAAYAIHMKVSTRNTLHFSTS